MIISKFGGIFFTKIEPRGFWENVLQFDVSSMLFEVESGFLKYNNSDDDLFRSDGSKTMGGFVSLISAVRDFDDMGSMNNVYASDMNIVDYKC